MRSSSEKLQEAQGKMDICALHTCVTNKYTLFFGFFHKVKHYEPGCRIAVRHDAQQAVRHDIQQAVRHDFHPSELLVLTFLHNTLFGLMFKHY